MRPAVHHSIANTQTAPPSGTSGNCPGRKRVQAALHRARIDAPARLDRDILHAVDRERRRLADDPGTGRELPQQLAALRIERVEPAVVGAAARRQARRRSSASVPSSATSGSCASRPACRCRRSTPALRRCGRHLSASISVVVAPTNEVPGEYGTSRPMIARTGSRWRGCRSSACPG